MVFQIFDTWRPQLFFQSVILRCQQYNDFLLAAMHYIANKLMIMASQTILGIISKVIIAYDRLINDIIYDN